MQTNTNDTRTAAEARAWLAYHGVSVARWAREHGFSRELVYQVLAGKKLGVRGQSHDIAVLLGMKAGALRGAFTQNPSRSDRQPKNNPKTGSGHASGRGL